MKIAYILPINVAKYTGVLIKVKSQVNAWLEQGNDVMVFLISGKEGLNSVPESPMLDLQNKNVVNLYLDKKISFVSLDLVKDFCRLKSIFKVVENDLKQFSPDIIYARSSLYQPFYKRIGKKYNLILEINTDMKSEYKLQAFDSFKYLFRFLFFISTDRFLFKYVSGVSAVTFDIANSIEIKEKKVFPNSISIYDYPNQGNTSLRDLKKSILFIGTSKMSWHGLDILLELATKTPEILYHVIGISEDEFKNAPKNVLFYGVLNKNEYLPIFNSATAAIGSLAFYRNNMEEACPLKVREYLACCKPVILPYKDTAFELNGYPDWVLKLPNSKEGILNSVKEITSFINKCDQFEINKNDVKKYVDVSVIEKNRLHFFKEVMDKK
ncbi:hypothetical protein QYR09_07280 [Cellulophaga lytica]|nr:hypothetical protein QYR09_07280 [Cellulophaga lytica]